MLSDLYRSLYRIRCFEETVLENFPKGVFYGTTHTYLGQEANAVGVLSHLQADDIVVSNHRCHGHFLAYGGEMRALFAELMGKSTGVCGGRGGSQHLHWRNFYSNGILGGTLPIATGMALAEKRKRSGAATIAFLGDGALGQGVVYEALNMASLWSAPILYVVENNRIAQTTPIELALAGDIAARFDAFGIPTLQLDTSDVLEILPLAGELLAEVRAQSAPRALILHTCRFGPHSKGDDTRDSSEIVRLRAERDPLVIHRTRLPDETRVAVEAEVEARINTAFHAALHDPLPTQPPHHPTTQLPNYPTTQLLNHPTTQLPDYPTTQPPNYLTTLPTVLESLNLALQRAFAADPRVCLLGEDVLDPYGGAFKVTRGLSTAFPDRVLTTPISEAGILGVATGMALRGLRPVVEIMFGDFITLLADQLINHLAKFRWMYSGGKSASEEVLVPVVIRAPMGGRRGYGPTHSQTLEKLYLGVPGLRVLAACNLGDPGRLLEQAILHTRDPLLFIENKLLYLLPLQTDDLQDFDLALVPTDDRAGANGDVSPSYLLRLRSAPPATLTIAAYGYMAELARQAARRLAYEHEIFSEVVVPTQLAPFETGPIAESARRTRRLLVIEEGNLTLGWGAEIVARIVEGLGADLQIVRRLAAADSPIPASLSLEEAVLPDVEQIVRAAQMMV